MLFVIYEGDSGDPCGQTMRIVRAKSLDDVRERFPHACMVQKLEKPNAQEPPNIPKLKAGMPVWGN